MINYDFFSDYKRLTDGVIKRPLYAGYVHEQNETDLIVAALKADNVLFDFLFNIILDSLQNIRPHKSEQNANSPYIRPMPGLTYDPAKFLAGCLVIAFVFTVKSCGPDNGELSADSWSSRYSIVNQFSRCISNLYTCLTIYLGGDFSAYEDPSKLAFGVMMRLQFNGVLLLRVRRVEKKTEYFLRVNIKLPQLKWNTLKIFELPQKIVIFNKRPLYLDMHFTHICSVITNNSANIYKSTYTNPECLSKLSSTKVYFMPHLAEEIIRLIKARYPELSAANSSSEALALLRISAGGGQTGCAESLEAGCQRSNTGVDNGAFANQRTFYDSKKRGKGASKKWSEQIKEETYASYMFNMYALYLLLERRNTGVGGFYYRFSMDFRGRIYNSSIAGFTYNKLVRYCTRLELYTEGEVNMASLEEWERSCYAFLGCNGFPKDLTNFQSKCLVNSLLELGKLKKSGYAKMSYMDFIECGLGVMRDNAALSVEDSLAVIYYKDAIKYAMGANNCGHIFYKDATASGPQILGVVLGCKNEEVSNMLNLRSLKFWFDTYRCIIDKYLSVAAVPDHLLPYFNRKTLKKSMMIFNYNASYVNCLKSFIQSCQIDQKSDLYIDASKHFRLFYLFLASIFDGDNFFENPSSGIIKILDSEGHLTRAVSDAGNNAGDLRKDSWRKGIADRLNKEPYRTVNASRINEVFLAAINRSNPSTTDFSIRMPDGFSVSYNYMEAGSKRFEVKPSDNESLITSKWRDDYDHLYIEAPKFAIVRSSIKVNVPTESIDLRSMERSFRANFTHTIDASILRAIMATVGGPLLGIHDCAGVRVLEIRGLKEAAKVAYSTIRFSSGSYAYSINTDVTSDFVFN